MSYTPDPVHGVLTCDDLVTCIAHAALDSTGLVSWYALRRCSTYFRNLLDRKLPSVLKSFRCIKLGGSAAWSYKYTYDAILDMIGLLHASPFIELLITDTRSLLLAVRVRDVLVAMGLFALDVLCALGLQNYCKLGYWQSHLPKDGAPVSEYHKFMISMRRFHNPSIDANRRMQVWKLYDKICTPSFQALSQPDCECETTFQRLQQGKEADLAALMRIALFEIMRHPAALRKFYLAEATPDWVKQRLANHFSQYPFAATLGYMVELYDVFVFPNFGVRWTALEIARLVVSHSAARWSRILRRHANLFRAHRDFPDLREAADAVQIFLDAALAAEIQRQFQILQIDPNRTSVSKSVLLLNAGASVFKESYEFVQKALQAHDRPAVVAAGEMWHSVLHQQKYHQQMYFHGHKGSPELKLFQEIVQNLTRS